MLRVLILFLSLLNLSLQRDPFCPLERNENQCRARKNQFKCGAFFMSLAGQDEELRWLGALPDMLHKPSVRKSRQLMDSMGNVARKNFRFIPGFCNEILSNIRCHKMMESVSKLSFDSCEHSMLNEKGQDTLGNILCRRAQRFAPGQNFQSFVKIGFYHSACGGNWTETTKGDQHLQMEEELCCRFEKGQSEYFKCTGGNFRKTCSGSEPETNEIGFLKSKPFVRTKASKSKSSSQTKPPPVIRVTPKKGDVDSLIAAVSQSGDDAPDKDRTPRRLALGEVHKTVHKVQTSKKKIKPLIRTYYVNREGRITRTELN